MKEQMDISEKSLDPRIEAVASEIQRFILIDLGRDSVADLSPDEDLFDNGVLDSMGIVELIAFCEQKYGITFDLSMVSEETFSSLNRLARSVLTYTSQAA